MIAAVAVLAAVAAEGLAVYAGAEWIASGYTDPHPEAVGAWAFVLAGVAGFGLPRVLQGGALGRKVGLAIAAVSAYVVLYGIMRIEFAQDFALWDLVWIADFIRDAEATSGAGGRAVMGAILLIGIWVRSTMRSDREIELEFLPREVGLPFVVVTAVTVVAAATSRSGEVARAAAAFYAVAVIALACSQLALSGATIGNIRAGGITATLLGGTVAATLVCVLVFGLLFSVAGGPIGTVLGAVIDRVLLIVLTPIAWVIQKLIELFLGNRDPLPQLVDATQQRVGEASSNKTESQSALQQGVVYALRVLALAIILAVTAGLTVLFVRMRRRLRAVQLEAAQSGAAGSLGQDLRTLWGSLFQRESSGRRGEASSRAIRLYQDVLERAEETGHPRGVGQTAEEFAPTLADTFRAEVTDDITAAFEQARYADREPDAATLIELERRWRLVR